MCLALTQLDKILAAQTRQSEMDDLVEPVHDEHLFIITHQSMLSCKALKLRILNQNLISFSI